MSAGQITRKFTRAPFYDSTSFKNVSGFLAGTTYIYNDDTSAMAIILAGLNFEDLRNLPNLKITGFTIKIQGGRYNASSGAASKSKISFRMVTNYSSVSSYTDICGSIAVSSGSVSPYTEHTYTQNDIPALLTWMNNNIASLLNGYTSNTFGMRLYLGFAQVKSLDITLNYEYEDGIYNIISGSKKVKSISFGSINLKKVYLGSKKIFSK